MLVKAYEPQCRCATHCADARQVSRRTLTLLALALGTFCIGTSEFASMGILELFAAGLGLDIASSDWRMGRRSGQRTWKRVAVRGVGRVWADAGWAYAVPVGVAQALRRAASRASPALGLHAKRT